MGDCFSGVELVRGEISFLWCGKNSVCGSLWRIIRSGIMVKVRMRAVAPVAGAGEMPEPDVRVLTSDGICITVHSKILAAASPVLENMMERHRNRRISILGVPYEAVSAFIQFLYSFKCDEDHMDSYGIHLLALSHVYMVPQLKKMCVADLTKRISISNVVDMLQLARLCNTPDLYIKCIKLLSHNFKKVEETEGWKFLQNHDPYLELEILLFIDEYERRKKRVRRRREEQRLYWLLNEAMECLEHICTEGCTIVGPSDMDTSKHKGPCSKFSTCYGLQLLIKHFGTCQRKVKGGCFRCKRMWQLFKLHSSVCNESDGCRVPLCRQLRLQAQHDARWTLLVSKVVSAKAASVLPLLYAKKAAKARGTGC